MLSRTNISQQAADEREKNQAAVPLCRRLSVAPMMSYTDRHARYLLRQISRRVLLYTEMITANAVLRGDTKRLLDYHAEEHPIALQVGGSDPHDLASCARIAEDMGYDEINLNVGCPSRDVQQGRFGACLMAEPNLVAACVGTIATAVNIPVTVKTRTGIDDQDAYEQLHHFVTTVAAAGCRSFIIHARKAWLTGISPKQNRDIPPLEYEKVFRLKLDVPCCEFILNGGVESLEAATAHLARIDGVMIGRAAYHTPYMLADADSRIFAVARPAPSRRAVVEAYLPYVAAEYLRGTPLVRMTRHLTGLFNGWPGARSWRRAMSDGARCAGPSMVVQALNEICPVHAATG